MFQNFTPISDSFHVVKFDLGPVVDGLGTDFRVSALRARTCPQVLYVYRTPAAGNNG